MAPPADVSRPPWSVGHADSREQLASCWPVIRQLRPALTGEADWLERATSMNRSGYRVLAAWLAGDVVAMAGYRVMDNLIHGHFLYVDDLVSDQGHRGGGLGAMLLAELDRVARAQGCARLVLDTAAANTGARRFYGRQGLLEVVSGFVKPLD